jgi:hypothetical protein
MSITWASMSPSLPASARVVAPLSLIWRSRARCITRDGVVSMLVAAVGDRRGFLHQLLLDAFAIPRLHQLDVSDRDRKGADQVVRLVVAEGERRQEADDIAMYSPHLDE